MSLDHVVLSLSLCLMAAPVTEATENPFVGVWELVSVLATASDESVDNAPYGPNPHGYITYTSDGYMTVLFSFGNRPHINGTWRTAPESDRAEAFATVLGYAGTYSVDGNTMTHHVTVSTDPNRVGTSISRTFEIGESSITLTTPSINLGDSAKKYSLTWRRVDNMSDFIAMPSNKSPH